MTGSKAALKGHKKEKKNIKKEEKRRERRELQRQQGEDGTLGIHHHRGFYALPLRAFPVSSFLDGHRSA